MMLHGSCLCGSVRYEVDRLDMAIAHCHCVTCRKAHAAAYASKAGIMREHFRWTAGEERLCAYESSPGKLRRFCSVCGAHVMAERPSQPHVILRVATLNDDPGSQPVMHIWTSHDVPWLKDSDDLSRHPQWPSAPAPVLGLRPSAGQSGHPVPEPWRFGGDREDGDRTIIRPATLADIGMVRTLLVETWHDTYDSLLGVDRVTETIDRWHAMDVLAAEAASPNASFLVACRSSEIVGHALAVEQDADVLLLSRLYVLPTSQRQGIGEVLLAAAVSRHPKTKRVQLVVEARNAKALAFYDTTCARVLEQARPANIRSACKHVGVVMARCRIGQERLWGERTARSGSALLDEVAMLVGRGKTACSCVTEEARPTLLW